MLNVIENTKKATAPQVLEDAPERPVLNRVTADWFHQSVLRGRKEVFCEIVTLTPELARYLLAANTSNRAVKTGVLETYKQDIKGGRWALNGEAVKIARDGSMIDGQHRCWGVVETETPIKTLVMFGIDRDSRMTLDQGASRTAADYLAMEGGVKYAIICSGIARTLLSYRLGGVNSPRDGLTRMAIRAEYWANEKEINAAASWGGRYAPGMYMGGQVGALSALVLARRISPNADDFMEKFVTGSDLPTGSPILSVRNKLITTRGLKPVEKLRIILRAFDAWLDDAPLSRIYVRGKKGLAPKKGK